MRIKFTTLIALTLAGLGVAAWADGDREKRHVKIERFGQGACPHTVRIGEEGPEIMRLGSYAYLGVELTSLTPELRRHFGVPADAGVMVGGVEEDSPAAAADLSVGDIITRFDGEDVESGSHLARLVRQRDPDDEVVLEYWRDGEMAAAAVTLDERQRCGFDLSHVIDLDLGHIDLDNLPRFEQLLELHEFDGEAMEKAMERAREAFSHQDWDSHLERLRDVDLSEIEERLHEVMERLHELEEEIHTEKQRVDGERVETEDGGGESEIY